MADPEVKFKHSLNRKKNIMAKHLFDPGEHRGAYAMKVQDSRKQEYKRKKMRVSEIEDDDE
jgi:hypothetical protein